ncbi:MAG: UDP-N-acetylglucosamine 2-epimerase [Silvanigrellaceae bacterium]
MESEIRTTTLDFLISSRREAMHLAPVIHCFRKQRHLRLRVVSLVSNQQDLNEVLQSLSLPADIQLGIRGTEPNSGTYLGEINMLMSELWSRDRPHWLVSFGHEDIAFAVSSAAFQNKIPIAHIEDVNRVPGAWMTNHRKQRTHKSIAIMSDLIFTTSVQARNRLIHEGIREETIFPVGTTISESGKIILANLCPGEHLDAICRDSSDSTKRKIVAGRYILADIRYPESANKFAEILPVVAEENPDLMIVIHSSEQRALELLSQSPNVRNTARIFKPKHLQRCSLFYKAACVLTDNDESLEECSAFGTKGVLLGESTERFDIVASGMASIAAIRAELLARQIRDFAHESCIKSKKPGELKSNSYPVSARIVDALTSQTNEISQREKIEPLSRQAI